MVAPSSGGNVNKEGNSPGLPFSSTTRSRIEKRGGGGGGEKKAKNRKKRATNDS